MTFFFIEPSSKVINTLIYVSFCASQYFFDLVVYFVQGHFDIFYSVNGKNIPMSSMCSQIKNMGIY